MALQDGPVIGEVGLLFNFPGGTTPVQAQTASLLFGPIVVDRLIKPS